MAGELKIRVSRTEMLQIAEQKYAQCLKDHEAAVKARGVKISQWAKEVESTLKSLAADVRKTPGQFARVNGNYETRLTSELSKLKDPPEPPSKPVEPALLQMLRISTDDSFLLTEQQYRTFRDRCEIN